MSVLYLPVFAGVEVTASVIARSLNILCKKTEKEAKGASRKEKKESPLGFIIPSTPLLTLQGGEAVLPIDLGRDVHGVDGVMRL